MTDEQIINDLESFIYSDTVTTYTIGKELAKDIINTINHWKQYALELEGDIDND